MGLIVVSCIHSYENSKILSPEFVFEILYYYHSNSWPTKYMELLNISVKTGVQECLKLSNLGITSVFKYS